MHHGAAVGVRPCLGVGRLTEEEIGARNVNAQAVLRAAIVVRACHGVAAAAFFNRLLSEEINLHLHAMCLWFAFSFLLPLFPFHLRVHTA